MAPALAKEAYTKVISRLNSVFTDIFYQVLSLLSPPTPELANSMFSGSVLGVTPRILPSLLSQGRSAQV